MVSGALYICDSKYCWPISNFAALSVLGFTRILHSVIATERHKNFYSDEEFDAVMSKWGKGNDQDNRFKAHFITGFSYLIIFPVIAYFISLI